jgi:hypothetical protein
MIALTTLPKLTCNPSMSRVDIMWRLCVSSMGYMPITYSMEWKAPQASRAALFSGVVRSYSWIPSPVMRSRLPNARVMNAVEGTWTIRNAAAAVKGAIIAAAPTATWPRPRTCPNGEDILLGSILSYFHLFVAVCWSPDTAQISMQVLQRIETTREMREYLVQIYNDGCRSNVLPLRERVRLKVSFSPSTSFRPISWFRHRFCTY